MAGLGVAACHPHRSHRLHGDGPLPLARAQPPIGRADGHQPRDCRGKQCLSVSGHFTAFHAGLVQTFSAAIGPIMPRQRLVLRAAG